MSKEEGRPMELARLLDKVCEEQLSEPERQQLNELLRGSEEARRQYLAHINMHAALSYLSGLPEVRFDQNRKSPPPAGKSPVLGFLGECFNSGASFLWKSSVFSVLVAVGLPIAMFVLVFVLVYETPPGPVALIARSRDCAGRLDDRPTTFHPGSNLFAEQTLVIDEGVVEIHFADGAAAVLEGPAAFEILGGNAGSLTRGRLAAEVPPEARGFTIETPSAKVVDLGTEFGVLVDDDGRVEAHVFGGQVEVIVPGESADLPGETALLAEGEAVQIAAADPAAKSSKIVRIPAATQQFTRTISLPEPTILFAHRGSADPTTQGWKAHYRQYGAGIPRQGKPLGQIDRVVGPIEADGTAAWRIRPVPVDRWVIYEIKESDVLTRELRAEAKDKGWVLRAHVWMDDKAPRPGGTLRNECGVTYRDGEHTWSIYPRLDDDGNQYAKGTKPGTGPFADSRNRYVQYELRYDPVAAKAQLYVNGRLVATRSGMAERSSDDPDEVPYPVLRFAGTRNGATEVRFARVEWGILRDADETKPRL